MDPTAAYSVANLGWLSTQAVPLIIWPSFICSVLRTEYQPTNDIESYFARALGFALLTLGLTVVVLSGVLPLDTNPPSSSSSSSSSSDDHNASSSSLDSQPSPYASAVVLLSALHHAFVGFHCHSRYSATDQTGFLLGTFGSAGMAVFGVWYVLFAGDKSRVTKKRGLDKNMGSWPFRNKESYKAQRKGQ
jgi:hypothetical protein